MYNRQLAEQRRFGGLGELHQPRSVAGRRIRGQSQPHALQPLRVLRTLSTIHPRVTQRAKESPAA